MINNSTNTKENKNTNNHLSLENIETKNTNNRLSLETIETKTRPWHISVFTRWTTKYTTRYEV